MSVHLVSIKVCVVALAVGVVQSHGLLPRQNTGLRGGGQACQCGGCGSRGVGAVADLVRHDGGLMEGGLSVHEQHVPILEVPEHLWGGDGAI